MQRPTAVTILGILNILFAIWGLVGMAGTVLLFTMANTALAANNPVIQQMHESPAFALWMEISVVLGAIVSLLLLVAGIGLLKLKPWGRQLSIGYAIYAIAMVPVGIAMSYHFLLQPMLEHAHTRRGPEAAAAMGGAIGGIVGSCFGLIYPVVLLVFMLLPKIAAVFRPERAETSLQ